MRVLTAALVLFAVYFPAAIYAALSYGGSSGSRLAPAAGHERLGKWLMRLNPLGAKRDNQSCGLQRWRSSGIRYEDVR
jgi:hypothetical protein